MLKKALYLDRDGVINIEKDYLYKIEEFEFMDGIVELIQYYQNRGYLIIVVTNQSGIARGYYSDNDFDKLTKWMIREFKKSGVDIKDVFYCPHHPEISGECDCRKPKPGMLHEASLKYDIDLASSIIIGDKERDIEAGLNAGLREAYLFDASNSVVKSKATKIVSKLEEVWKSSVNFK